jgi:hypothetical protein
MVESVLDTRISEPPAVHGYKGARSRHSLSNDLRASHTKEKVAEKQTYKSALRIYRLHFHALKSLLALNVSKLIADYFLHTRACIQTSTSHNVFYKRGARTSEAPTPPSLRTYSSVHLNHVKRQHIYINTVD